MADQNFQKIRVLLHEASRQLDELHPPQEEGIGPAGEWQPGVSLGQILNAQGENALVLEEAKSLLATQLTLMKRGVRASLPTELQSTFDELPEELRLSLELDQMLQVEQLRLILEIPIAFEMKVDVLLATAIGDFKSSLKNAEELIEMNSSDGEAHLYRIKSLLVLGQTEPASLALLALNESGAPDDFKRRAQFLVDRWKK